MRCCLYILAVGTGLVMLPATALVAQVRSGAATLKDDSVQTLEGWLPEPQPLDDPSDRDAAPSRPETLPGASAAGRAAFENACTACHDANRSLEKRKTLSQWLTTIRRMAAKEGADISPSDVRPIAEYLVGATGGRIEPDAALIAEPAAATALYATISPLWRGGNDSDTLEHPGFFPDAWVGAQWTVSERLRGEVTACTTCHNTDNTSVGFELVRATVAYDLLTSSDCHWLREVTVEAGRFVVPFGAFSSASHPGIYRTVTNPLPFMMGRRVGPVRPRQPVLPAPYADEGVRMHAVVQLWDDVDVALDAYAVNGLQQGGPNVFLASRSYWDNNSDPATGFRASLGNRTFRIGGSLMNGDLQPDGDATQTYRLAGADATLRWDIYRAYFEYAIRDEDSFPGQRSTAYGIVAEGEIRIAERWGLLARYDTLEHRGALGEASLDRFTWGVNYTLPGGSLLVINHERWNSASPVPDVDVVAIRWTASF